MKRFWTLPVLALGLLLLAACGTPSNHESQKSGGQGNPSQIQPVAFRNALALIQDLNHHGVLCRAAVHPGLGPELADGVPEACELTNGARLTVLIVPHAARTYQKQFANAKTSARVLYGANWLVIAPDTVPAHTINAIKNSFHARG